MKLSAEQLDELVDRVAARVVEEISARIPGLESAARRRDLSCDAPEVEYVNCPPVAERGAYIYFLRSHSDGLPIKIGYARDLSGRLSAIQNGNPHLVVLLAWYWAEDYKAAEAALHEQFASHRIRGEWFRLAPTLLAKVSLVAKARRKSIDAFVEPTSFEWRGRLRDGDDA